MNRKLINLQNLKKAHLARKKYQKEKDDKLLNKMAYQSNKKDILKAIKKPNIFAKNKKLYEHKLIDHVSPTGKSYIGVSKKPLMKSGYGYKGVLLQDENRKFVMCNECGKWMKKITEKHLQTHGLTSREYKKKHGLFLDKGLVSDETSMRLTKAALKNKTKRSMPKTKPPKTKKKPMEYFNKHETCPLQLKTRLFQFIIDNKELPSQCNKGRRIYKAIYARYGRFGKAITNYGLPYFERIGTTYLYKFEDGSFYTFNINQMYDREELYSLLITKCPELKEYKDNGKIIIN